MYESSTCCISQVKKGQYHSQNNSFIQDFLFRCVSCMFDSYSQDVFLIDVFFFLGTMF